MTDTIKGKLSGLKSKMHFSRHRGKPPETGNDDLTEVNATNPLPELGEPVSDSKISKSKQMLESIVVHGLLNLAENRLSDDAFVDAVFEKAYELLPAAVRLAVSREVCRTYLHSRKKPLLAQLQQYRHDRLSITALPAHHDAMSAGAVSEVTAKTQHEGSPDT
ncbi:hypothetical protein [Yersinia massiliensis]|uniref:Uncharacterized protein n=1 Tax=Yersinia massiliensis TaxID=419257 RepID=A0ABM6UMV1_9GAMM|nr:hypothetical protein [Yersinia massiliensis]AVX36253.1 hypothetical protein DA391_00380 [Yersinia massiliensis]QKJ11061.1 hypothetical protein HRD68_10280 [Yersinia massiliensis]